MISSAVVLTEERLREEVEYFSKQEAFVFDVETSGDTRGVPHLNTVTWLSMATRGRTIVIPMGHPIGTRVIGHHFERRQVGGDGPLAGTWRNFKVLDYETPPEQLDRGLVFDILRPLFEDPYILKAAHGASFDLASTYKYFGFIPWPATCTILLDWIQNENRIQYKLKRRVIEEYGVNYDREHAGRKIEEQPFNKAAHYGYCDARYDWMLYEDYVNDFPDDVDEIYNHIELPILKLMVKMRLTGAPVDVDRLKDLRTTLTREVEDIRLRLFRAAGNEFNVNSSQQKQDLLYGDKADGGQGLKPWKLTKGGKKKEERGEILSIRDYSTDAEALESFPTNKLARTLLEYQEVYKLLSTYILGWLGDPTAKNKPGAIYDGRIYADFVQYGTVTGRFSCREPNLQNIPRSDTENGKLIRSAFIAPDGYKLITADYDQIELVILAHYIGEGALYDGFMEGIDPHTMTAAMVFGVDPALVTPVQRSTGKSLNFAITYGAGRNKVASMIGCGVGRAQTLLERHAEEFPEIYDFRENVWEAMRQKRPEPYLHTLLGRKRRVPDLLSRNRGMRAYAERQAFNSLIQGGSADIIKYAMIRTDNLYEEQLPEAKLILTIHDELVALAPEPYAETAGQLLSEGMIGSEMQKLLDVPLKADVKIVQRWSDAK